MKIITSFNEMLFHKYGKRMIEEFSAMSDGTVTLAVIYEGKEIPNLPLKNVIFTYFNHSGHHDFIRKFGHLNDARGLRIRLLANNEIHLSQDFKFDAVRFSFKIFALLQALELFKLPGYFAWLDADIRCLKKFGSKDLLKFFPDEDQLMSYLGRSNFPSDSPYSECGFLGFNSKHPKTFEFLSRMAEIYQSGEIFTHEQWHDSWIWDQTRIEFESRSVKFKNISGVASSTEHPFVNSDLGIFFDHLKGPKRKEMGESFIQDYVLRSK